jgi:hypothetical protein
MEKTKDEKPIESSPVVYQAKSFDEILTVIHCFLGLGPRVIRPNSD